MRSFLDTLDGGLRRAAAVAAAPAPAAPPLARNARQRWLNRAGIPAALVAGAAGVLTLSAGTPSGLPVLDAPSADASALAGGAGVPPSSGYDLRRSRAFPTPAGTGYVVPSRDGGALCVVLPDGAAPRSFGSGCAPRPRVETDGLAGEVAHAGSRSRPGRTQIAFVLPRGAGSDVRLEGASGALPVSVHSGVAVATLETAATLRYEVGGAAREQDFSAPLAPPRTAVLRCGRQVVEVPPPPEPGPIDQQRLCRQRPHGDREPRAHQHSRGAHRRPGRAARSQPPADAAPPAGSANS